MPTCYVVTGSPRSGTSLTAGLLHRLGVLAGKRLMAGNDMNPKGFFIDLDFEELLEGYCTIDSMPDAGTPLPPHLDSAVREIVRSREAEGKDWAFKSLTMPLVAPILLQECGAVKQIRLVRNAESSRASLKKWTAHSDEAIDRIRSWCERSADWLAARVPTLTLDFDDIIDRPGIKVAQLAGFAGKLAAVKADVVGFVDADLRRF